MQATWIRKKIGDFLGEGGKRVLNSLLGRTEKRDAHYLNALYSMLYHAVHDLEQSLPLSSSQTLHAFATQWRDMPAGKFMLSDPEFKRDVERIMCEEEMLLRREWFKGRKVMDAGCGNGRWAYGFAKLGADLTIVDGNSVAIESTKRALSELGVTPRSLVTQLENLDSHLQGEQFDLVFSWGVLHHCRSFNKAFENVVGRVKEGGIIYLYLYGRESLSLERDIATFKERVLYTQLSDDKSRMQFLLDKAGGDPDLVHGMHDVYAPLINRRLDFGLVKSKLEALGFTNVERTIEHTELWVRAVKGTNASVLAEFGLPSKRPPYWFQR